MSDAYRKYFVEMQFERRSLFQAVRRKYNAIAVLYPGCFVHITPSFFFPHVVYVDSSEDSRRYFAAAAEIQALIQAGRHYKRAPYLRFIHQDYRQPFPLAENSFDLLLSLYAGGISQACKPYLKTGELLLSNDHQDDAAQAARDPDFRLVGVVNARQETYSILETDLDGYFIPEDTAKTRAAYRRSSAAPKRYTRSAAAYMFCKI